MLISLSFCLSVSFLISLSNLNEILAGCSIPGCWFSSFIPLNVLCHSLLACRVSAEKSADSIMRIGLYEESLVCLFVAFPLLLLVLFLSLISVSLISLCLSLFFLRFTYMGISALSGLE